MASDMKKERQGKTKQMKKPTESVEKEDSKQKDPAEPPKEIEVKKAEPVVAHEGSSRAWHSHTPIELRQLLPGRHTLPYVYLKHHQSRYQGVYQCDLLRIMYCLGGS